MKYILLFLISISGLAGYGQNPTKIAFEYDEAGNQTVRKLCFNCSYKSGDVKDVKDITPDDLQQFFPGDVISYYPNPVKEQLYLKWELMDGVYVSSIQLHSLNGQLIKAFDGLRGKDDFVLSFTDLPRNVYAIVLVYTNGEQKSIKIIKN